MTLPARTGRVQACPKRLASFDSCVPYGHWLDVGQPVESGTHLAHKADCNQQWARRRASGGFWYAELLLAFWVLIGFKPGDFMITGMNEKRTAWLVAF